MILESALLEIRPGESAMFETAMAEARALIAASPGFHDIEVRPCLEQGDRYLLLVWWDSVEDHEVGFRGSARYEQWRALLHRFYDPMPNVAHFGEPIS